MDLEKVAVRNPADKETKSNPSASGRVGSGRRAVADATTRSAVGRASRRIVPGLIALSAVVSPQSARQGCDMNHLVARSFRVPMVKRRLTVHNVMNVHEGVGGAATQRRGVL